jgi:hypothetical protein
MLGEVALFCKAQVIGDIGTGLLGVQEEFLGLVNTGSLNTTSLRHLDPAS